MSIKCNEIKKPEVVKLALEYKCVYGLYYCVKLKRREALYSRIRKAMGE